MKIKELRAIAKVMEECGIVFLKTADIEIHRPLREKKFHVEQSVPIDAPFSEEKPIEHKTVELTSVMKLSDEELANRLFPDHTQEVEAS